jgi:hypothetical protein
VLFLPGGLVEGLSRARRLTMRQKM